MGQLAVVMLAGFLAAMIDGSLGMGFGPTSATLLMASGLSPLATSTTVNLAKVATGIASGVAHVRLDNVDRKLVVRLALPGALGAGIGAWTVTSIDGDDLRPILALMLMVIGLRILVRFSSPSFAAPSHTDAAAAAAHAGPGTSFVGAAGGVTNSLVGAWGPVVTPYLIHRGLPPRYAIGSVNTAEVVVAVVSAGSLLSTLRGGELDPAVVVAMLVGGVLAAPLAARTVRHLPARALGMLVAGLLLATQARELHRGGWIPVDSVVVYLGIGVLVGAGFWRSRRTGTGEPTGAPKPGSWAPLSGAPTSPDPRSPA